MFLRVVQGKQMGLSIPLDASGSLLIGRKRANLVLDDPLVSGQHCRVFARGEEFVVEDLGSTNGTLVDGRPVHEAILQPGSEITVGETSLVVVMDGESNYPSEEDAHVDRGELAWLLDSEVESEGHSSDGLLRQHLGLPPATVVSIAFEAGPDRGKQLPCHSGSILIGRRQGDVPLEDTEVSRHHAIVEVFGRDMVFVRDLASTNGTFHNGRKVHFGRLDDGDTLGCGKTVLRLCFSPAAD